MAGINRLGKAAPRPGSLRPPDPTRHRITDHFSENVEGLESDRDYQRAVQDIEDAQQTQGWLFGRGAFDKTDLLYLRDQEEKSRHTEIELHDKEVKQYAKLRAHTDKQKPSGVLSSSGGLSVTKKIEKDKTRLPPKALQRIVKVSRTAGPAAQTTVQAAQSGNPQASATAAAKAQEVGPSSGSAGLESLLGAYGSGSDSEGDNDGAPAPTAAKASSAPAAGAVPDVASAAAAAEPPPHVAAAATAAIGSGRAGRRTRSRSKSPAGEQHDEHEALDYGT